MEVEVRVTEFAEVSIAGRRFHSMQRFSARFDLRRGLSGDQLNRESFEPRSHQVDVFDRPSCEKRNSRFPSSGSFYVTDEFQFQQRFANCRLGNTEFARQAEFSQHFAGLQFTTLDCLTNLLDGCLL